MAANMAVRFMYKHETIIRMNYSYVVSVQSFSLFRSYLRLKAHRQITKTWCFKKYCSYNKACQFSAL